MSPILKHITDVGAASGNGIDSTLRIERQYERLGQDARVISAGHSPLHVAFAGSTDLTKGAQNNAQRVLQLLGQTPQHTKPIALNCAPRNSDSQKPNGQESHIFRVNSSDPGQPTLLLYGPEVLRWIATLRGNINEAIERIISIDDIITDTSNGSQFRSAEHLPIAHILEDCRELDKVSTRRDADSDETAPFSIDEDNVVILPPDEYSNGRILINNSLISGLTRGARVNLSTLELENVPVASSLTEVVPGKITIWPSSNWIPNDEFRVYNIGTRWKPGTTRTTDEDVLRLGRTLTNTVGTTHRIT